MAVKKVITMGHPTLRKKAKLVTDDEFNSKDLTALIQDLKDTMHQQEGIGIAAPQIDVSKQVCLICLPEESRRYDTKGLSHELYIVINPKIKVLDNTLGEGIWEGCLSVPGLRGFVRRPKKINVSYQTETGESKQLLLKDMMAIVFQHEIDHLQGKLFVDRLVDTKHLAFEENLAQ